METLLRTQLSPLPTQTILGLAGSMATAPMDCTAGLSNTGLKLVPALTDFQTTPLAEAANTVRRPPSLTAATAAMRPLICAEPMLRAGRPEMVPESKRTGACAKRAGTARRRANRVMPSLFRQRDEGVLAQRAPRPGGPPHHFHGICSSCKKYANKSDCP